MELQKIKSSKKQFYLSMIVLFFIFIFVILVLMQFTNLRKILMGLDEINNVHECVNKSELSDSLCNISDASERDICYSQNCIWGDITVKRTFTRKPLDKDLLTRARCLLAGGKFEQAKMVISCDPPEEGALCWGLGYRCVEKE